MQVSGPPGHVIRSGTSRRGHTNVVGKTVSGHLTWSLAYPSRAQ